jgi:hypothetical protein
MTNKQWIWIYGIKPRDYLMQWQPTPVESKWLNPQRPLDATERTHLLDYLVSTSWTSSMGQPVPPTYTHLWWCAWNDAARSFGPWSRHYAR